MLLTAVRQCGGISPRLLARPGVGGRCGGGLWTGIRCHHVLASTARSCAGRFRRLDRTVGRRLFTTAPPAVPTLNALPAFVPAFIGLKDSAAWQQFKSYFKSLWPTFSEKSPKASTSQEAADDSKKTPDSEEEQCAAQSPQDEGEASSEETATAEPALTFGELWRLILPDLLFLVGAVVTAMGAAFINIRLPQMLAQAINETLNPDGGGSSGMDLIKGYLLQAVFTCAYISCLSALGERMAARLREKLFRALLVQDVAFFDAHKTGELVNRLTSDVQDFKSSFKLCISQGLRSATQAVGSAISLYYISPELTYLIGLSVPVMVLAGTLLGAVLRKLSSAAQAQVSKSTSLADEVLGNIRTVRAFGMEDVEDKAYSKEVQSSAAMYRRLGLGIGVFQGLSNFAINMMTLAVLGYGCDMLVKKQLEAGNLTAYLIATQALQRSLAQVSLLFGHVVRGWSAGNRVFEFIKQEPTIPIRGGLILPLDTVHGDLRLNDVRFIYPTRPEQVVLNDLNLHIPAGKTVALCGPSGGGKTTIAALIERFYDPSLGDVTLDGVNIRELDPSWLRTNVLGYINQEPVLFATSVMENIRYGRPGASNEEVIAAAKSANVDGFVSSFPDGYDTVLGERGVTVSGGQRQRIAIARALLKNPKVLLLDEATSALDAESEHVVQEALNKLCEGRTVVVIAHRLSTIRDADTIAVVMKGQIVEQGSHNVLIGKKSGVYADLVRRQSSPAGDF